MWVYLGKQGQVLEYYTRDGAPRAGSTNFKIIVTLGDDFDFAKYPIASIKLYRPDLNNSPYPIFPMQKATMLFSYNTPDVNSNFRKNKAYNCYVFDFSDFEIDNDKISLLDTAGKWRACVTLVGNGVMNVVGSVTFDVGSGNESEDLPSEVETLDLALNQMLQTMASLTPVDVVAQITEPFESTDTINTLYAEIKLKNRDFAVVSYDNKKWFCQITANGSDNITYNLLIWDQEDVYYNTSVSGSITLNDFFTVGANRTHKKYIYDTDLHYVSYLANQGLDATQKANARANIGAGTSNFSGSYGDLTGKPTIGNGKLTIKRNGVVVREFTANQTDSAEADISVPTKVSDLSNDTGFITLNNILPRFKDVAYSSTLSTLYTTIGANSYPFIMRVINSSTIIGYYLCKLEQATVGTSMTFEFIQLGSNSKGKYYGTGVSNATTLSTILSGTTYFYEFALMSDLGNQGFITLNSILPRFKDVNYNGSLSNLYSTIGATAYPFIMRVVNSGDIVGYYLARMEQAAVGTSFTFDFIELGAGTFKKYYGTGVSSSTLLSAILSGDTYLKQSVLMDGNQAITGDITIKSTLKIGSSDAGYTYSSLGLYNSDTGVYDYLYGGSDGGDFNYPYFGSSLGVTGDVWVQGDIRVDGKIIDEDDIQYSLPGTGGELLTLKDCLLPRFKDIAYSSTLSDLFSTVGGANSPFVMRVIDGSTVVGYYLCRLEQATVGTSMTFEFVELGSKTFKKYYGTGISNGTTLSTILGGSAYLQDVPFEGVVANTSSLPGSGNIAGDLYWVTAEHSYYVYNGTSWEALGAGGGGISLTSILPRFRQINLSDTLSSLYVTIGAVSDPFIMRVIDSSDVKGYYLCQMTQASVGTSFSFVFKRLDAIENGEYSGTGVASSTTLSTIFSPGTIPSYFTAYGPTDYIHYKGSAPGINKTFNTSNTKPSVTDRLNLEANLYVTNLYSSNGVYTDIFEGTLEKFRLGFTGNNADLRIAFEPHGSNNTQNLTVKSQIFSDLSGWSSIYSIDFPLKSGTIALLSDIPTIPTTAYGMYEITKGSNETFTSAEINDLLGHKAYFKATVGSFDYYFIADSQWRISTNVVTLTSFTSFNKANVVYITPSTGAWTVTELKNTRLEKINTTTYNSSTVLSDLVSDGFTLEGFQSLFVYNDANYDGLYSISARTTGYNAYEFAIVDLKRGYTYSGSWSGTLTLGSIIAGPSSNYYSNAVTTGYATEAWVGNQGYLTSASLSGYATESWVENKGYLTSSSLSGYATETWVGNQGYITGITVTDSDPTLDWNTRSKVATIDGVDIHVTMPANPNSNYYLTAGSWNGTTYSFTSNGGNPAVSFTLPTVVDTNLSFKASSIADKYIDITTASALIESRYTTGYGYASFDYTGFYVRHYHTPSTGYKFTASGFEYYVSDVLNATFNLPTGSNQDTYTIATQEWVQSQGVAYTNASNTFTVNQIIVSDDTTNGGLKVTDGSSSNTSVKIGVGLNAIDDVATIALENSATDKLTLSSNIFYRKSGSSDYEYTLPNETGVLATRTYAQSLITPSQVGTGATTQTITTYEGTYKGFQFNVGNDRNGLYVFTYGYNMVLIPAYGLQVGMEYKIPATLLRSGSYNVYVLTYRVTSGGYLEIYNKNNYIESGYTAYLFKVKLY